MLKAAPLSPKPSLIVCPRLCPLQPPPWEKGGQTPPWPPYDGKHPKSCQRSWGTSRGTGLVDWWLTGRSPQASQLRGGVLGLKGHLGLQRGDKEMGSPAGMTGTFVF